MDPACKLETGVYSGENAAPTAWQPVARNQLANTFYKVLHKERGGPGGAGWVALELLNSEGNRLWLRNTPVGSGEKDGIDQRWRCAVETGEITALVPKQKSHFVRLDTSHCTAISPILGSADDISSSTYTVTGASLFIGKKAQNRTIAVGVRLEAEGGEKRLTVPSTDFDACFVGSDRAPPPPEEAHALQAWLAGSNADETAPPGVSLETVEAVMGIDRKQCIDRKFESRPGLECHTPLLRLVTQPGPGPFGPNRVAWVRERLVNGLYFRDGRLVPPTKAVTVNALVRTPDLPRDSAFAASFNAALGSTIEDPSTQMRRAARGRFRLSQQAGDSQATHLVDIHINYAVPELQTSTEPHTHEYLAGKKQLPNPARPKAESAVQEAQERVAATERESELVEQGIQKAKELCDKGGDKAAKSASDAVGGGLWGWVASTTVSTGAGAACNGAQGLVEKKLVLDRIAAAKAQLDSANASLAGTPEELAVDDKRIYHYDATRYTRHGEATAKLQIAPVSKPSNVQLEYSVRVPFDASDTQIPDVPEVKLAGREAHPPSAADAERALAQALVPLVDQAILRWGAEREVGGDVGEVKPGTRSWMVLVARQAATDRPVKLLSDVLDDRKDTLAKRTVSYPVVMPEGLAGRCFTFGAIAVGSQEADVNLELSRSDGDDVIARDERSDADAAFEVCDLRAAHYRVKIDLVGPVPDSLLVSMFDSTPGRVAQDEVRTASMGIPAMPRRGEVLQLNGTGAVAFKGTAGQLVVGVIGDRDGDSIPDNVDRCPYEREIVNGYLDDDGCPDEPPPGWQPPAPVAPAVAAAAPKAAVSAPAPVAPSKPLSAHTDKPADAHSEKQTKKKKTVVFVP
ncbi:MAG TPA: hypothetical protein VGM29_06825 [Polyangiaceae bacterium]